MDAHSPPLANAGRTRRMGAMYNNPTTFFARVNHRAAGTAFGIRKRDRRYHMHVLGKTGVGKSTLLKTMILQDLRRGEGLALFDPHGDLALEVLELIPPERRDDLLYLGPPGGGPWYFNPLADVPEESVPLAVAGLVEAFKKIWSDDWGPRLEHLLRNVLYTLLAQPEATLGDIPRLFSDKDFRKDALRNLENEEVRDFWKNEFEGYSWKFRAVVVAPLQNKIGAFLTDPHVRSVLLAPKSSFDLPSLMDEGTILIANLAKGRWGEGPSALLGSLLLSAVSLAGLARADRPEEERPDFFVYLDEFQTFATLSLATMLSELRKYRINMILANQYFAQLEQEIRDAVLGNAGTLIAFRLGAPDASLMAREFAPTFEAEDLVNLPNYHIYLRLMIDGQVSKAFSGVTVANHHF